MDIRMKHPFTALLNGPTKSGKTEWAKKFVKNANTLIDPAPARILWCYREYQRGYEELANVPNLELIEGLPDWNEMRQNPDQPKLIILDDFMCDFGRNAKNDELTAVYTRGSHHWGCSIIHIIQNAFYNNLRTVRINSQYLILMKSVSDKLQVRTLARQLFPDTPGLLLDAYKEATSQPFGYLLIDLSPTASDQVRLRTSIFDDISFAYIPKV